MTTENPVAQEPVVAEPVTKKQKIDEGSTQPPKAAENGENGDTTAAAEPMKVVEAAKEAEPIAKDAPAEPAKEAAEAKEAAAPATEEKAEEKTSGWEGHTLNINLAIDKESEVKFLADLAAADVTVLQGIGSVKGSVCEALGVKTVSDLAEYSFYKMAKAIVALAPFEEKDARKPTSTMNVDKAVTSEYEKKSLTEMVDAPVSALEGLSAKAGALFEELGVKTIKDLASFKYCVWAESITTLGGFEHTQSAAERKKAAMLKRLE